MREEEDVSLFISSKNKENSNERGLHIILHTGDDGNLLNSLKQVTCYCYVDCTSKELREREKTKQD